MAIRAQLAESLSDHFCLYEIVYIVKLVNFQNDDKHHAKCTTFINIFPYPSMFTHYLQVYMKIYITCLNLQQNMCVKTFMIMTNVIL